MFIGGTPYLDLPTKSSRVDSGYCMQSMHLPKGTSWGGLLSPSMMPKWICICESNYE